VTFSYDNYSNRSIPVKPRIFRIRTDVSWEEVVENYKRELASPSLLNGTICYFLLFFPVSLLYIIIFKYFKCFKYFHIFVVRLFVFYLFSSAGKFSSQIYFFIILPIFSYTEPSQKLARYQIGHWNSSERGNDMRDLLEKVASRLELDPLFPETWYSITRKNVEAISVLPTHLLLPLFSFFYCNKLPLLSTAFLNKVQLRESK
jgi:hypothetical protein